MQLNEYANEAMRTAIQVEKAMKDHAKKFKLGLSVLDD